ncbi:lipid-A-disaccharide synthase [Celeribacter arenosi]|uniref:Lipid-A-disaccharide synthase n=1 Tax=Celeribacter arenosi TaxID=792649 RepID=A0ABP7KHP8_9RHOB
MTVKVFVIAGEPSGDRLAASAMAGLKSLTDVEFRGVGGALMAQEGLQSQFPMSELTLMGLFEVLPKYFHLKRRIREVAEAILAWEPDVVLTVDAPDFCLRVAEIVKARSNIRICHYVAPTVWAWRPKRALKMAARVDQVLALFPFEPPYFETVGLRCDFVGHPVVAEPTASPEEAQGFRNLYGISDDAPLILVLPGSRQGEVSRLAPVFGQSLHIFAAGRPETRVVIPVAHGVEDAVREATKNWPCKPVLIRPDDKGAKRAAFRAADMALAASGTVSLELAAADTPMVVAYRMNRLTEEIMRRKLLVDTVTLVNLVSDTRHVEEFLGPQCRPASIASALARAYLRPQDQRAALATTMERLGQGGEAPGLRAARAILDGLGRP